MGLGCVRTHRVPPYVSAAADAASAAAVGTSPGAWGFAGAPPLSDFAPHEPAAGLGLISSGLDVCPPDAEPTTSVEYTQLMQGAVVVGRVVQCQVRADSESTPSSNTQQRFSLAPREPLRAELISVTSPHRRAPW
jgi:hypothetical protein